MNRDFQEDLTNRIDAIRAAGLWRAPRRVDSAQGTRVMIAGQVRLNFSSNDYLGLANHPKLRESAQAALERFGAGAGASRMVCGTFTPHLALEEALSAFKGTEATLVFSSGYAAAAGTIPALVERNDVIVVDKLVHASVVDAAKASGARLRVFPHNDLSRLEEILRWTRQGQGNAPSESARVLVVTESVFSMDGDVAPLREIVELKDRFGAWLMVDEAHATGLFGARGSGLVEALGLCGMVEVQMGTLGKALGTSGGTISGSRRLIDFLINRARSFIFSTAPMPATAAAATTAVELVQSSDGATRRGLLWSHVQHMSQLLSAAGVAGVKPSSAILPLIVGDEAETMRRAGRLFDLGFLVPGIRYPTVARGRARLRITLSSDHLPEDLQALADALHPANASST